MTYYFIPNCKYYVDPDGNLYDKKTNAKADIKPSSGGYIIVYVNKKPKRLHRLMAEHWLPNPDNKPFIDHNNRIRTDNHLTNLSWVTHKENMNNTVKSLPEEVRRQNFSTEAEYELAQYHYHKDLNDSVYQRKKEKHKLYMREYSKSEKQKQYQKEYRAAHAK